MSCTRWRHYVLGSTGFKVIRIPQCATVDTTYRFGDRGVPTFRGPLLTFKVNCRPLGDTLVTMYCLDAGWDNLPFFRLVLPLNVASVLVCVTLPFLGLGFLALVFILHLSTPRSLDTVSWLSFCCSVSTLSLCLNAVSRYVASGRGLLSINTFSMLAFVSGIGFKYASRKVL